MKQMEQTVSAINKASDESIDALYAAKICSDLNYHNPMVSFFANFHFYDKSVEHVKFGLFAACFVADYFE
jgi:hypothetical protein